MVERFEIEMTWLLDLKYNKFWSQMLFCDASWYAYLSFVYKAPKIIDKCEKGSVIEKTMNKLKPLVFRVVVRLGTVRESENDFFEDHDYAEITIEYDIFLLKLILKLCRIYGSTNRESLVDIINNLFNIHPKYVAHIETCISNFYKIMGFLEYKLTDTGEKKDAPEITHKSLKKVQNEVDEENLHLFISLLLNTLITMKLFLDILDPVFYSVFHSQNFTLEIVSIHDNTIQSITDANIKFFGYERDNDRFYEYCVKTVNCKVELCYILRNFNFGTLCKAAQMGHVWKEHELLHEASKYMKVITDCAEHDLFFREYIIHVSLEQDLAILTVFNKELGYPSIEEIEYLRNHGPYLINHLYEPRDNREVEEEEEEYQRQLTDNPEFEEEGR